MPLRVPTSSVLACDGDLFADLSDLQDDGQVAAWSTVSVIRFARTWKSQAARRAARNCRPEAAGTGMRRSHRWWRSA